MRPREGSIRIEDGATVGFGVGILMHDAHFTRLAWRTRRWEFGLRRTIVRDDWIYIVRRGLTVKLLQTRIP